MREQNDELDQNSLAGIFDQGRIEGRKSLEAKRAQNKEARDEQFSVTEAFRRMHTAMRTIDCGEFDYERNARELVVRHLESDRQAVVRAQAAGLFSVESSTEERISAGEDQVEITHRSADGTEQEALRSLAYWAGWVVGRE